LELRRGLTLKKGRNIDVLVEVGPMQAASSADYQPIRALRGSAPPKTRIPLQRYADRASVLEIHEEALVRYSDVPDSVLRAKFRSIHSKRPSVGDDAY
jgi:hypothetical protein